VNVAELIELLEQGPGDAEVVILSNVDSYGAGYLGVTQVDYEYVGGEGPPHGKKRIILVTTDGFVR